MAKMNKGFEIVTVDAGNVGRYGFFCYKSKPKSQGYQNKLNWLRPRFDEGLRIKILFENGRSVGFIEYTPAEHSWRVIEAPGYLIVHCIWVVGRGKNKGHGSRLLDACVKDAQQQGKHGVAMVSSTGNWLANEKLFLKNDFRRVDTAPPSFSLLAKEVKAGPVPVFPQDWETRLGSYPSGVTIIYADQCPYMPNAVRSAVDAFAARGIEAKVVKLESSAEVKAKSPTPYGVLAIVCDGSLLTYHVLGGKELRHFDDEFLSRSKRGL
jgi:hypothetical protein